ncbi:MAG: hypothetical protein HUJ94_06440, partial [Bacteroidales bacterium]|nr:hypothetical protein [Bacteroidales bacterium]
PVGQVVGIFRPYSLQVTLGGAMKLGKFFSTGMNLRYTREDVFKGFATNAVSGDLFASFHKGGLTATAGARDIGHTVAYDGSPAIPSRASLGAGYVLPAGKDFSISLLCDLETYVMGAAEACGSKFPVEGSAGGEVGFREMIFLRAGYHWSGGGCVPSYLSAGGGVSLSHVRLDFCYVAWSPTAAGSFSFGLAFSF